MPLHDRTGPLGLGPGTGRGRGGCYSGFGCRTIVSSIVTRRSNWLIGIAAPLVAAVVRDLLNPSGMIRSVLNVSSHKRVLTNSHKKIENKVL
jgi:hypothetical protein